MASNSTSQSPPIGDEVVTDAAHPLFLKQKKKNTSSSSETSRSYCPQCKEELINNDSFLSKHFRKIQHKPISTCKLCNGNVYEYSTRQPHTLYHKCEKRAERSCNTGSSNDYNGNSTTIQKSPTNDQNHSELP